MSDMYNNSKLNLTSAVFVVCITFAVSFSNERLPTYWWQAGVFKRLLMGIVSTAVYVGLTVVSRNLSLSSLDLIPFRDFETRFSFRYIVPCIVATLLCYGLFPLLFSVLGLTKR